MDPWGFSAEQKLGHSRFLASPAVKVNPGPASLTDTEDFQYMQSFPTVLYVSDLQKEKDLESAACEERKMTLSSAVETLYRGAVPAKKVLVHRSPTKRDNIIASEATSPITPPIGSPLAPLHFSRSQFPGIQLRKTPSGNKCIVVSPDPAERVFSPDLKDKNNTAPFSPQKGNSDDHLPVLRLPVSGVANDLDNARVHVEASNKTRRKSSSSSVSSLPSTWTTSSRMQKVKEQYNSYSHRHPHSHFRKDKHGQKPNSLHCGPEKWGSLYRGDKRLSPHIYGSSLSPVTPKVARHEISSSMSTGSDVSTCSMTSSQSNWSRKHKLRPDIEWDSRYQKSPYDIPAASNLISNSGVSGSGSFSSSGPESVDSRNSAESSYDNERCKSQQLMRSRRLYCA